VRKKYFIAKRTRTWKNVCYDYYGYGSVLLYEIEKKNQFNKRTQKNITNQKNEDQN
jgi:hypothetical protein